MMQSLLRLSPHWAIRILPLISIPDFQKSSDAAFQKAPLRSLSTHKKKNSEFVCISSGIENAFSHFD